MAYNPNPPPTAANNSPSARRTGKGAAGYPPPPPPGGSPAASNNSSNNNGTAKGGGGSGKKPQPNKIWSTSSLEERERIRDFWLGLGEEERRELVKIEKDTVLRKMKEQQKHSCSCAVCGRKRYVPDEHFYHFLLIALSLLLSLISYVLAIAIDVSFGSRWIVSLNNR